MIWKLLCWKFYHKQDIYFADSDFMKENLYLYYCILELESNAINLQQLIIYFLWPHMKALIFFKYIHFFIYIYINVFISSLNVRVLLLVRDPRGILQSRKHRGWCPGNPDCDEPALVCSDMVADYEAAKRLRKLYPDTFRYIILEQNSYRNHFTIFSNSSF